jgi:acyl carrier protein
MNKDKVKQIMVKVFELDTPLVNDEISQKNIDEWDSLNHLNLMVQLEEEFEISLSPEQIASMTSLKTILEEIQS